MATEMLNVAVRAVAGTLLFRTHAEARALWLQIVGRVRPFALALMPDHLHAMLRDLDEWFRLRLGLRAYALQRNHLRREKGPVFEHDVIPRVVPADRVGRERRYIHLNPCRVTPPIVRDPLAYDFTSHRDAVRLAVPLALTPVRDRVDFHKYVSSDPKVRVDGTLLPVASTESDVIPTWSEVLAAVSALTRTPAGMLATELVSRDLIIHGARRLARLRAQEIADRLDLHAATVHRVLDRLCPDLPIVRDVIGDPRFALLPDDDLRGTAGWRLYRNRR